MIVARLQAGNPGSNGDLALTAIAAVVLGGTAITGGNGSMLRTVAGVALIAVLKNGLDNLGVPFVVPERLDRCRLRPRSVFPGPEARSA